MQRRTHPEQGFRSCIGIIRLAKRYTPQRLENACKRAVVFSAFNYRSVESILKKGLDSQLVETEQRNSAAVHTNIRGAHYYHQKEEIC
jgi:transposase